MALDGNFFRHFLHDVTCKKRPRRAGRYLQSQLGKKLSLIDESHQITTEKLLCKVGKRLSKVSVECCEGKIRPRLRNRVFVINLFWQLQKIRFHNFRFSISLLKSFTVSYFRIKRRARWKPKRVRSANGARIFRSRHVHVFWQQKPTNWMGGLNAAWSAFN